jgi:chemotaxis protein methyltransferase CheR
MKHLGSLAEAQALALAIVDTLPEPFLVLDDQLQVLAASRCFYEFFKVDAEHTSGCGFFQIGGGQWDIPPLRLLLETIIPQQRSMDGFVVEHDFLDVGPRTMLLNARMVRYEDGSQPTILLAFKDITHRRRIEREKDALLQHTEELLVQQQNLVREMEHRIANSLQIIAAILLLKARAVTSDETRHELQDAHNRVMSVAAVHRHLHAVTGVERIGISAYLNELVGSLAASMIGPERTIAFEISADATTLPTTEVVSIGLIVTELVINAIKYAFPPGHARPCIQIGFEADALGWRLTVSDNGVGKAKQSQSASGGLGTAIIAALGKQLKAQLFEVSGTGGLYVSLTQGTLASDLPLAA